MAALLVNHVDHNQYGSNIMEPKILSAMACVSLWMVTHNLAAMDESIVQQIHSMHLDSKISSDEVVLQGALSKVHALRDLIEILDAQNEPVDNIEKNIRKAEGLGEDSSEGQDEYKKQRKVLTTALEKLKQTIEEAQQERVEQGLERVKYNEQKEEETVTDFDQEVLEQPKVLVSKKKCCCNIC